MRHVLLLLLISACATSHICYNNHYSNVTSFKVTVTRRTSNGVALDDPKHLLNDTDVDFLINHTVDCLRSLYPSGKLPPEVFKNGMCVRNPIEIKVQLCLTIKTAPNWYLGCSGQQLFTCNIDPQLCKNKGLEPTPECPCACRDAVQDNNTIVVTPNIRLLGQSLIRTLTGCNWVWTPGLQECFMYPPGVDQND